MDFVMNQASTDLNRAIVLHQGGEPLRAIPLYRQFLASHPDRFDAHINLGIALEQSHQPEAAINAYRSAIQLSNDHADTHYNLGNLLAQDGQLAEAVGHYRETLRLVPQHADAALNAGNALLFMGDSVEACEMYRSAIAINPVFARAHYNLGQALCRTGLIEEGFQAWSRAAELLRQDPPLEISPQRERHEHRRQYHLATHVVENLGHRIPGQALNPSAMSGAVAQWTRHRPGFAMLDNVLSNEALARLRQFCCAADVWRTTHRDGYLIATPENGFSCPLLAQIATELRRGLPDILGSHPLHYLAGFKYHSQGRGTGVHADNAAINVNLWITPDKANQDPEHGGIIVWDTPSPEIDSTPFNGDAVAIRAYLADQKAKPTIIPYRANRMIVFDSHLFHETDTYDFCDGYQDQRINITFLFGDRSAMEA
jgi:tetratricopeptide (TPR) repeat protein